jgi:hypothetical protein
MSCIYIIVICLVIAIYFTQKSENMVDEFKIHDLPSNSKRCGLCDHCKCNIIPHQMPSNPVLYYGGKGKYIAKNVSRDNHFYMCDPNTFNGLEPPVPSKDRQCFISQDINI